MKSIELARNIRIDALRMSSIGHASHIASAFSVADIIAVLYADILKYDINNPRLKTRDRLVLSKGHASASLYSALAEVGFFSKDELWTYCQNGSRLCGHVSRDVPGIEASTGSLGHGLGIAVGYALDCKLSNQKHRVFCIIGDGECDEGSVWEAALFANNFELSDLTVICDHNKMQALGFCENIIKLLDLRKKWESFGWEAVEINGHDHKALYYELSTHSSNKPKIIIADTIKGKGVSFMENNILWHYKDPQGDNYLRALNELENKKNEE